MPSVAQPFRRTWLAAIAFLLLLIWSGVIDNRPQGSGPEPVSHELASFTPAVLAAAVVAAVASTGATAAPTRNYRAAFLLASLGGVALLSALVWQTIGRIDGPRHDPDEGLLLVGACGLIAGLIWLSALRRRKTADRRSTPGSIDELLRRRGAAMYVVCLIFFAILGLLPLIGLTSIANTIATEAGTLILIGCLVRRVAVAGHTLRDRAPLSNR